MVIDSEQLESDKWQTGHRFLKQVEMKVCKTSPKCVHDNSPVNVPMYQSLDTSWETYQFWWTEKDR